VPISLGGMVVAITGAYARRIDCFQSSDNPSSSCRGLFRSRVGVAARGRCDGEHRPHDIVAEPAAT